MVNELSVNLWLGFGEGLSEDCLRLTGPPHGFMKSVRNNKDRVREGGA